MNTRRQLDRLGIDLDDEAHRKAYYNLIDEYRLRYVDRALSDLGVLIQRVKDDISDKCTDLEDWEVLGRKHTPEYRGILERQVFKLLAELSAINSLIDESRLSPDLVRQGHKFDEIGEAVAALEGQEFSSRRELLLAVDQIRGVSENVTYRYLYRRFGASMPNEVAEFIQWIANMRALRSSGRV